MSITDTDIHEALFSWYNRSMKIRSESSRSRPGKSWLRELVEFLLLVMVIVIPFRVYVAEPYIVSGVSMSNTFETGHYLIINKFWHKISPVERGDTLVFLSPDDSHKFYIKRAIGLPGETVSISNQIVSVTPVGSTTPIILNEPYVVGKTYAELDITLKDDEYFMMGDNREHSYDSRSWGVLHKKDIKGEPVLRLFPFTSIGLEPGRYNQYNN